ncbi:MAG TPA: RnfH family protein [Steroidobacteraceae bacterium]|nr:RnfH family protein [Steroidobacteraceae bacterium]
MNEAPLQIEIAYAEPQRAIVKSYILARGSRVADALRLAALDPDFTGVDLENATVGIFGRVTGPDRVLEAGDRVEIYRPLAVDPKVSRRQRAKQARR